MPDLSEIKVIDLIIPGKPIAKKRPRFARRGNFVSAYSAQETEEGRFLWEVNRQLEGRLSTPLEGALELQMDFIFAIPASFSAKKRSKLMLSGVHINKPDIDNLQKFSLDCLNGILFRDDRQIAQIRARKWYGLEPKTIIHVEQIGDNNV